MLNSQNCKNNYKIQLPAIEIAVSEWGPVDGKPVLALHGWLDNLASFYPIANYKDWLKQKNIRLIAIDWPGHGHSDHRHFSHPYNYLEYVQDLHDIVDVLEFDKITLLGHSMGGGIGMIFAASFPQLVERLILIEGISPMTQDEQEGPEQLAKAIRHRNRHQNRDDVLYQDLQLIIKARLQHTELTKEYVNLLVERNMDKTQQGYRWRSDPRLRLPSHLRLTASQAQAFIDNLSIPVLLLYGKEGFANKYPQFQQLITSCQHFVTKQLPGGHHLHMTYPDAVINALCQFVDG